MPLLAQRRVRTAEGDVHEVGVGGEAENRCERDRTLVELLDQDSCHSFSREGGSWRRERPSALTCWQTYTPNTLQFSAASLGLQLDHEQSDVNWMTLLEMRRNESRTRA